MHGTSFKRLQQALMKDCIKIYVPCECVGVRNTYPCCEICGGAREVEERFNQKTFLDAVGLVSNEMRGVPND